MSIDFYTFLYSHVSRPPCYRLIFYPRKLDLYASIYGTNLQSLSGTRPLAPNSVFSTCQLLLPWETGQMRHGYIQWPEESLGSVCHIYKREKYFAFEAMIHPITRIPKCQTRIRLMTDKVTEEGEHFWNTAQCAIIYATISIITHRPAKANRLSIVLESIQLWPPPSTMKDQCGAEYNIEHLYNATKNAIVIPKCHLL